MDILALELMLKTCNNTEKPPKPSTKEQSIAFNLKLQTLSAVI